MHSFEGSIEIICYTAIITIKGDDKGMKDGCLDWPNVCFI